MCIKMKLLKTAKKEYVIRYHWLESLHHVYLCSPTTVYIFDLNLEQGHFCHLQHRSVFLGYGGGVTHAYFDTRTIRLQVAALVLEDGHVREVDIFLICFYFTFISFYSIMNCGICTNRKYNY